MWYINVFFDFIDKDETGSLRTSDLRFYQCAYIYIL